MTRLLAAIAFLTRVPIRRPFEAKDVGRSALFFPLVGAGIGLAQLGAFLFLRPHLPPLLVAVLVVALSAWVTRGLHLDGLADFTDGLGGGRTAESSLVIMRDPRVGAFGVVALVLVLAVKIAALSSLRTGEGIVLAPALARWASVPMGLALPYARASKGLGAAITDFVGRWELLGSTLSVVALGVVLGAKLALVAAASVAVATVGVGLVARSRLGGVTGDVLGANTELAECVVLIVAVLL